MKYRSNLFVALIAISSAFALLQVFGSRVKKNHAVLELKLELPITQVRNPLRLSALLKISNRSNDPVDFAWTVDPLETMTIQLIGDHDKVVESISYAHRFSIVRDQQHLVIESGKDHEFTVTSILSGTEHPVPPGRYKILVSMIYADKEYRSNRVDINILED